jgi:eukaryotic-like serine/threonine-protein kinase
LRIASSEHAEQLLARAQKTGLIDGTRLEQLRNENLEDDEATILELVVAQGWITEADLNVLRKDEATDLYGMLDQSVVPLPPEVAALSSEPDRCVADLVLVEQIGRGGTGTVWRAWDRKLGRWVAVKLASAAVESTVARQRFSREVLATARLSHPNIVPVFQVGAEKGRAFLVMALVEGQSLVGRKYEPTRAVQIIRDVARAVHHAHERGIIHRDLKPGNIMEDPTHRVMVLDFGLAYLREDSASRLTRAGDVLGTAGFMAPEQARGESIVPVPTVDVYGLGATLYALVTGQSPFSGDTLAAVVAQVITGPPPRPGRLVPELDSRIEAIIAKAMDREPRFRYPSAAAMADDLDRVLLGKAALPGMRNRWWVSFRTARRRIAMGATIAAISLAALTLGIVRFRDAREKQAAMGALRDIGKLALDTALQLRRSGDTKGMKKVLPQIIAAHGRLGNGEPVFAEAEYLLGRTYRALFDEAMALRHQERALALDPNYAPALYEHAVLLSFEYGRVRTETLMGLEAEGTAQRLSAEQVQNASGTLIELRRKILSDCDRLRQSAASRTTIDAALGILAFHRLDYNEARDRLRGVVSADPLMEEAWDALAHAEAAAGNIQEAETIYQKALTHDRGYAPFEVGRCQLLRKGRPFEGMKAAESALDMDPGSIDAEVCWGGIASDQSHHRYRLGLDPTDLLDRGEVHLANAIAHGGASEVLHIRGLLRRYRGLWRIRSDGDPEADFRASIADFEASLGLRAHAALAIMGIGRTSWYRAVHRYQRGLAPDADLGEAMRRFKEASTIVPTFPTPYLWQAEVLGLSGVRAANRADALVFFDRAESALDESFKRGADGWSRMVRGTIRTWRGSALAASGKDPWQAWATARSDLDRAMAELDPGFAELRVRRGLLYLEIFAQGRSGTDSQATSVFNDALADLNAAIARDPRNVDALLARGRLFELAGDHAAAAGDADAAKRLQPTRIRSVAVTF